MEYVGKTNDGRYLMAMDEHEVKALKGLAKVMKNDLSSYYVPDYSIFCPAEPLTHWIGAVTVFVLMHQHHAAMQACLDVIKEITSPEKGRNR